MHAIDETCSDVFHKGVLTYVHVHVQVSCLCTCMHIYMLVLYTCIYVTMHMQ